MFCPHCGAPNQEGAVCATCRGPLPVVADYLGPVGQALQGDHRNNFRLLAQAMKTGGAPKEELRDALVEFRATVEGALKDVESMEVAPEVKGQVDRQVTMVQQGLRLLHEGIAGFEGSLDGGGEDLVDAAAQRVEEGMDLLSQAVEIIREQEGAESFKDIIDMVG